MLNPQYILPIARELVVDLFAGGGGASTGIEQAIGRHVDIAINHDPEAVSLHQANHPQTRHYTCDVFEVEPAVVTEGLPVGLLWASPDCTFHSKARGGKPHRDRNRARRRRGLAGVVLKWAALPMTQRPRVIELENVEEFQQWGPLLGDGTPCPLRRGKSFDRWVARLRNLGYQVEWRQLRACDYGAPTIRKRLFVIARCDGLPIVWPAPTHAKPDAKGKVPAGMKPWRTAAECIDWSIPAPSIFERERPLADATLRRIAHGIRRYVVNCPRPFVVPITHAGPPRTHDSREPLRTVTTANRGELALVTPHLVDAAHGDVSPSGVKRWGKGHRSIAAPVQTVVASGGNAALVAPTLVTMGYGEREGQTPRAPGLDQPARTITAMGGKHGLVTAMLAKHYSGVIGHGVKQPTGTVTTQDHHSVVTAQLLTNTTRHAGSSAASPVSTLTTGNQQALVTSALAKLRGTSNSAPTNAPLGTVSAGGTHHADVRAFLVKYNGSDQDPRVEAPLHTVTTKDRFGLVTIDGQDYAIADIGMRMLQPRELYRAQGFPDSYVIDKGANGKPLSKSAQVRMCGNSVCPPLSCAITASNYREQIELQVAA
jgi:DNA (cytosine-5)-methyltransferase 1